MPQRRLGVGSPGLWCSWSCTGNKHWFRLWFRSWFRCSLPCGHQKFVFRYKASKRMSQESARTALGALICLLLNRPLATTITRTDTRGGVDGEAVRKRKIFTPVPPPPPKSGC